VGRYRYDALGRRVDRWFVARGEAVGQQVFHVSDGAQEVEEIGASGAVVADYVWGGLYLDQVVQVRRGGQEYFAHTNSMFSVAAITDASGAVVERYEYASIYGVCEVRDAAGAAKPASAEVGNPWRFQGRRYDPETGFYYFRLRYLDPGQGRFVNRDPLGIWGDPGQFGNAYSFAGNDPVNRVDPWGLRDAPGTGPNDAWHTTSPYYVSNPWAANTWQDVPFLAGVDSFFVNAPGSAKVGMAVFTGAQDCERLQMEWGMGSGARKIHNGIATGTKFVIAAIPGAGLGTLAANSAGRLGTMTALSRGGLPYLMGSGSALTTEAFVRVTDDHGPAHSGPSLARSPLTIRAQQSVDPLSLYFAGTTLFAPGPGHVGASPIVREGILYTNPLGYAEGRAAELQALHGRAEPTFGVGVIEFPWGVRVGAVSTSSPEGYVSPRVGLEVGTSGVPEIHVGGAMRRWKRHAEINIEDFSINYGLRYLTVGAGNYICDGCEQTMEIRSPQTRLATATWNDVMSEGK
jgi:RHS repeat-associated protein